MDREKRIILGIKLVGWFWIIIAIGNFLYILSLFLYPKEGLDQLNEVGGIPDAMLPMISVFMFYIGRGIIKKQRWARFAFISLTAMSLFIGIPYRIYENAFQVEEVISICLSTICAGFLMRPSVRDQFEYSLDWVGLPEKATPKLPDDQVGPNIIP